MSDEFVTRREYDTRHAEILELVRLMTAQSQANGSEIAELRGWVKGAVTGVGLLAAVATAIPFLLRG